MRIGLLARGQVTVSAFVEEGDRVLAHVRRVDGRDDPEHPEDELAPRERFTVAEVHDGQITHMRGYTTEAEAQVALHGGSLTSR